MKVIKDDMLHEKINIDIGSGVNILSDEHSTILEIRKFPQTFLELDTQPKGINLDKTSLDKLLKLSEDLMLRIQECNNLDSH